MLHRRLKNRAAITLLIRQLTDSRSFAPDDIRMQCKSVIYSCFLMGIEPFQLPIAEPFSGDLSEAQRRDFLQQYFTVHSSSSTRYGVASQILFDTSAWSSLLYLVDKTVDAQKA